MKQYDVTLDGDDSTRRPTTMLVKTDDCMRGDDRTGGRGQGLG